MRKKQTRVIKSITFIVASLALCVACHDDNRPLQTSWEGILPGDDWVVDGMDGTYDLPVEGRAVAVAVEEGDFLMPLDGGRIYLERNDEPASRKARLSVRMADGDTCSLSLLQQPSLYASAEKKSRNFYRHHGLGYSYNAVSGKYCNLSDVKCQLLNRAVLDQVEEKEVDQLLFIDYKNDFRARHELATSVVKYIQNTNFESSVNGRVILYSGSASSTCSVFEDGTIDTYIFREEEVMPKAQYQLEVEAVKSYIDKYPRLLTSSFRRAVERLAATSNDNMYAVDSFITTYGTHMVTHTELGSKLVLEVQVETHKFNTIEQEKAISQHALATMFKKVQTDESTQKTYQILRNSRCRMEVIGGDLDLMADAVLKTTYDNEHLSEETLDKWRKSVRFDDDDLENSNVELTDMSVMPIWELIPDENVAKRVEARVMGNAAAMQELLGNRNFINTSFPAHPTTVTCRIGNKKNQQFSNPDVVDVISANRHVATVCREYVPEITSKEKVFVAYPIYEGRVKLTDGLCIYGGKVYNVAWKYNRFYVEEAGDAKNADMIYMNGGVLTTEQYGHVNYQQSHLIVGCERPGGIAIDGSLAGEMVKVQKHFGHFYLVNRNNYTNLPGWSYVEDLPVERDNYQTYIGNEWKARMVRNDNYVYNYNVTEIGYE